MARAGASAFRAAPATAPPPPPPAAGRFRPSPPPAGGAVDALGKPGRLETFADTTADYYLQPTEQEQYWNGQQGNFGGGPQKSYAEQFNGSDPGLDPYYKQAYQTGSEQLNNRYASMGVGGGSAALNADATMRGNLGAEQANREADFRLRQAQAADTGRNEAEQTWLDKVTTGGKLAGGADTSGLDRRTAGANLAGGADEIELNRKKTIFDWLMSGAGAMGDTLGKFGLSALSNDQDLLEFILGGNLGKAKSAYEGGQTTRDAATRDLADIYKFSNPAPIPGQ